MPPLGTRLFWGLREAAWRVDEKVLWPVTDAIQYVPSRDGMPPSERESWWGRHGVDLAIAAILAVVAFLLRRHGLPTDGLWLDDAIQGAALPASPSEWFAVSADHPGFTVLLIGWRALVGDSDAALAYPTLAAGVLGPALLYLGLRYCGYERSIGVLLAAALAVAATDIVYSGRVKTYTIDILIVLALALIIPRLTEMRWRWLTGLAWVAGAAVLAFWSVFGLVAVAVAGAIIVLHPKSDLWVRVPAVAIQEAICGVLLIVENRSHDVTALEDQFRETWDAFVDFSPNPVDFGGEVWVHFRRVGEYFAGGTEWLVGLCVVAAIVALAIAAWQGRQAVRARYLLLLLLAVFAGGLLGKFPFGPRQEFLISSGGRVSLWLIPVVAIGLAAALHGLRGILGDRRPLLLAFDGAAYIAAIVVLVIAFSRDPVEYPFPGARSATEFIQSQVGERDAVLLGYRSDWSYAFESGLDSGIEETPETSIGYEPTFDDPRVHRVDAFVDPEHVAPQVGQANRVFVYYAEHPFSGEEAQLRTELATTLGSLGFVPASTPTFKYATVQIWARPGATAGSENLTVSDLPSGWRLSKPVVSPPGGRVLSCVGVRSGATSADLVAAQGGGGLNVFSLVNRWPSAAAASRAVSAVGRPAGAACVRSAVTQSLTALGFVFNVSVSEVSPPPASGPDAVAYHLIARDRSGGPAGAEGTVLFFSRGARSALIIGFRGDTKKPFPRPLLSRLASTLAQLMQAASP